MIKPTRGNQHLPEFIIAEIKINPYDILLFSVVYFPHKSVLTYELSTAIDQYTSIYPRLIMVGDFNADFLRDLPESRRINDFLTARNFTRISYGRTHLSIHRYTEIDMISYCGDLSLTYQNSSDYPVAAGHHLLQAKFHIDLIDTNCSQTILTRNFSSYSPELLLSTLDSMDWSPFFTVLESANVNLLCEVLTSNLIKALDEIAPINSITLPPLSSKPWKTKLLDQAEKKCNSLYNKYKLSNNSNDYNLFREARHEARKLFTKLRANYFADKLSKAKNSSQL